MPVEGFLIKGAVYYPTEHCDNSSNPEYSRVAEDVLADGLAIQEEISERHGTVIRQEIGQTVLIQGTATYYRQDRFIYVDFPEAANTPTS